MKNEENQQNTRARYLRLMTINYDFRYQKLLDLINEISPHQRFLNSLISEVYKYLNGISPDIMNDTLAVSKHQHNTRHYNLFVTDFPKTDRYDPKLIQPELIRYGTYCPVK